MRRPTRTRRRAALTAASLTLAASLASGAVPAATADATFRPETLVVPGNSITGVDTTQSLEAGALYRAVAWGTYDYGVGSDLQIADAECTIDKSAFNPIASLQPPLPAWVRHRFAFYGSPDPRQQYNLLNTDLRDPDPGDDAGDIYVDNRNVEWAPVGVSDESLTGPFACHEGDPTQTPHVYEVFFVPLRTGPINFRIFDVYYADNGAPGSAGENTLEVFVTEVAQTGLSLGRHVETVLVSAENAGATSKPLPAGKRFALIAHGMWSYQSLYDLADAECTRTSFDPTYRRDRYADGSGELWIDGAGVNWRPLVPAQVWARTYPSHTPATATLDEGCDATTHFYRTEVVGAGAPLQFELRDPPVLPDGAESGHLSVDIFEVVDDA